jgi:Protein of unknown function (DUF2946)
VDEAVIASMTKWPNVPDCYGWLHLDAQGRWLLGEIGSPTPPSIVEHDGLKTFINRNYCQPNPSQHPHCWALQNGPQRVWVNLALAPLIVRLHDGIATAHTGAVVTITAVYLSDDGVVYFQTDAGAAALQSASMEAFSQGLSSDDLLVATWQQTSYSSALPVQHCTAVDVERGLGFNRAPLA